jgi:hypothetical protein
MMRFKHLLILCVGVVSLSLRASATQVSVTIQNSSLSGTSSYVFAKAKIGTDVQKFNLSDLPGTITPFEAAASRTTATKSAQATSRVSFDGTATTLFVETNNVGTNTLADGYAQRGLTYVSNSPVPFTLTLPSPFIIGPTTGMDPGELVFEYRLDDLGGPIGDDRLNMDALPDDADTTGWGIAAGLNFYLLHITTPSGTSGPLTVINTILSDQVTTDHFITASDFMLNLDGSYTYIGPTDIHITIDPDPLIITGGFGVQQTQHNLTPSLRVISPVADVPEPSTILLVGAGLLPLMCMMLKRNRRRAGQRVSIK